MSRNRKRGSLPEDRDRPWRRTASKSPRPVDATRDSGVFAASPPTAREVYAASAVCAFLVLAVAVVFAQTVNFGFVNYDNDKYVYENRHVQNGLTADGIAWAFTSNHASNWHPLTWLSHMLDCELYGLQAGGHHLTNVALHALAAVVLFLVLWRMTFDLWPSAFVAAVFAVHPVRVESVAWIAERKDVLSGLFFMLTLWAYLGYVRRPFSLPRYCLVIVLFALGLMSKPMLVTMPFVLLLLDYWPLGRLQATWRRLIVEKIPLLLLAAASCLATMLAQQHAVVTLDELSLPLRFGAALLSYVSYLGQFFWPTNLAVFYPHPAARLPIGEAVAALLILIAISAVAIFRRRRNPYLFVGWFWYLGMLVPVIGLVQVGLQGMADRYAYLPQIGLTIALAWSAAAVEQTFLSTGKKATTVGQTFLSAERKRAKVGQTFLSAERKRAKVGQTFLSAEKKADYRPWASGVASALVLAGLMACAWRQTSFWRNSETLWAHTLRCTSDNDVAHFNLAAELMKQEHYDKAIEHYKETVRIHPGYRHAQCNLGVALARQGQTEEAIAHYYQAIKYDPDDRYALNNLASLRATSPRAALRNGAEAVALAERAFRLSNGGEAALTATLAAAYAEAGRFPDAVRTAREAIAQAKRQNDQALVKETEASLRLYMARKPYRQPAPVSPPPKTSNGRPDAR